MRNQPALEAAFISANAASYIASTYTTTVKGSRPPTLTLDDAALKSLNAFLDYLLAIIVKEAQSTELRQLKATLARILDSALGYVALNEAQAELETYRNQETGEGRTFDDDPVSSRHIASGQDDQSPNAFNSVPFDVEKVWLQARIRCMIYSTVGEKEETDFPALPTEDEAFVTPAVAIFLTAVLEFLGEHILLTAAKFARERIGLTSKGILCEEDLDQGVCLDKSLCTIWQGYLAIVPATSGIPQRPVFGLNSRPYESVSSLPSTIDRGSSVISTLPFFGQLATHQDVAVTQNTDQVEQPETGDDPSLTPVILRKASPALSMKRSMAIDQQQAGFGGHADHGPVFRSGLIGTRDEVDNMRPDTLGTISEAPSFQTDVAVAEPVADLLPPLQNPSSLLSTTKGSDLAAPGVFTTLEPDREQAAPNPGDHLRLAAASNQGLTSVNRANLPFGDGASGSSAPHETVRTSAAQATIPSMTPSTSHVNLGFESGLFQYNAQREVPRVQSSDNVLAEDYSSGQSHSEGVLALATEPEPEPERQAQNLQTTPTKNLSNSANNFAASASNIAEPVFKSVSARKGIKLGTTTSRPTSSLFLTSTIEPPIRYSQPSLQGLALRDLSNVEPGSDYESFLRQEMLRESVPAHINGFQAQRSRIVASRELAVHASQSKSVTLQTDDAPSYLASAARQTDTASPPKAKIPNAGSPREATVPLGGTQSLLLADFIRNTGPGTDSDERPRDSTLQARGSRKGSVGGSKPKPEKTTKAESRMLIETSSDTEGSAWDEEVYGPDPGVRRKESLTDFLRDGPPPNFAKQRSESPVRSTNTATKTIRQTPPMLSVTPEMSENEFVANPVNPAQNRGSISQKTSPKSALFEAPLSPSGTRPSSGYPSQRLSPPMPSGQNEQAFVTNPGIGRNPTLKRMTPVSDQRAGLSRATSVDAMLSGEEEDDDDSFYGHARRKPPQKESLADFLRSTAPPSDEMTPSASSTTIAKATAPHSGSPTSVRTFGKLGRRLSSLSILVGSNGNGNGAKQRNVSGPSSPAALSPARPNHRPLMH